MKALTLRDHGVKEADVLRAVKNYWALRGWRVYRMTAGGMTNPAGRYIPVGEDGVPDLCCYYYLDNEGKALVVWCEVKSPDDRRKCRCRPFSDKPCNVCRQEQWARVEEQRGGFVIKVDDLVWLDQFYTEQFGWLHGPDAPRRGQSVLAFDSSVGNPESGYDVPGRSVTRTSPGESGDV
jgi:hypothetical protein